MKVILFREGSGVEVKRSGDYLDVFTPQKSFQVYEPRDFRRWLYGESEVQTNLVMGGKNVLSILFRDSEPRSILEDGVLFTIESVASEEEFAKWFVEEAE